MTSSIYDNGIAGVVEAGVFGVPRYYFHIKGGQVTILDHEGLELADSSAAAEVAAQRCREIGSSEALPKITDTMRIVVADERWWPALTTRRV